MADHDHTHSHDDAHDHSHGHGHENDQGLAGMVRYLQHAPRMLKSEVNNAVVDWVAPTRGETVIDIGAGMGPAAIRAAAAGASVIAVEPTPFLRRVLALRRLVSRYRKRITVADGAAEALPTADQSVHAIWAVNTMHHWVDPSVGATEIARVLKPLGRVVLVDEDFANKDHPDHGMWTERHDEDDHHGFSMVDATAMGALLTSAGLVDVVAENRSLIGRPVIAVTALAP